MSLIQAKDLAADGYVKLNVGGRVFHTTQATLKRHPGLLRDVCTDKQILPRDDNGLWFVDKDPDIFSHILTFMRDVAAGPGDTNNWSRVAVALPPSIDHCQFEENMRFFFRKKKSLSAWLTMTTIPESHIQDVVRAIENVSGSIDTFIGSESPDLHWLPLALNDITNAIDRITDESSGTCIKDAIGKVCDELKELNDQTLSYQDRDDALAKLQCLGEYIEKLSNMPLGNISREDILAVADRIGKAGQSTAEETPPESKQGKLKRKRK